MLMIFNYVVVFVKTVDRLNVCVGAFDMKNFNDVTRCSGVEDLNRFICEYVDERKLEGIEKIKTYWALFYAWRDEIQLQVLIKNRAKMVLGL